MIRNAAGRRREPKTPSPHKALSVRQRIWSAACKRPRLAVGLAAGAAVAVCALFVFGDWYYALPASARPDYVGSSACLDCHREQAEQWRLSHHALAMQRATKDSVLGDFSDVQFTHHDVTSRMFKKGEKFFVNTEGPDGELSDFEVKYVFGVTPLQQYMVEFDRQEDHKANEIARLQVLRLSWNSEQKKWFYLPPPDVAEKLEPDDDLHWTGVSQRWNAMCADCHSTNLKKNYDPISRSYRTTFTDINVGCEACHGPGGLHVQIAKSKRLFWDRRHGLGLAQLKTVSNETQIHACAPCHSRRRALAPDFRPGESYHDFFACELLGEQTYHADGQISDEVYELGSFLQSKMFHKNVRCSDCHDPHTARLKQQGNQLCTSCHLNASAHPAGKYDTPAHHHHKPDSPGASCVECHMPETTYMEVDKRRDHSFRTPRPDLSVALGVPNACSRCHLDKADLPEEKRRNFKQYNDWVVAARRDKDVRQSLARLDAWAADAVRRWYDKSPPLEDHFAAALDAARRNAPDAEERLIQVVGNRQTPAIVRATAVAHLIGRDSRAATEALRKALADDDPLVRAAAVGALETSPSLLAKEVGPMLEDDSRLVRTEAARVLAAASHQLRSNQRKTAFLSSLDEHIEGLLLTNDRAGAHLNLGVLYESLGDDEQAETSYRRAMAVEPNVSGPRSNLASLLERRSQEAVASAAQASSLGDASSAENARQRAFSSQAQADRLRLEELKLLERDARLAPEIAVVQYRYGLSLYLHGRLEEAERSLLNACRLDPRNAEFALALALLYQKLERIKEAIEWTNKAIELNPDDAGCRRLLEELTAKLPAASS